MKAVISPKEHHAVIFDLDGVITRTASVHAKSWKKMFDQFLQEWSQAHQQPYIPFDEDADYLDYVDGKPRLEGIQSFLESRGINLSLGTADDPIDTHTVWALGNKKNAMFVNILNENGVEVYQSTIDLIREIRRLGIKTALISSSKNCASIIEKVGARDLFDAKIDGVDALERNIKGKPAPDIFLQAAKDLGVSPKHAVVVEDAISGVQAGRDGGFCKVIGVDRANQTDALLENGADVVVKDLEEVSILNDVGKKPDAIENIDQVRSLLEGKTPVIFLDYDGTLTPIVSHPDLAILDEKMKTTLEQLKEHCTIAVISGRDLPDVQSKIEVDGIFYAGSHGFDIAGPNNQKYEIDEGKKRMPSLDSAEVELNALIPEIEGAWVERKKYSIAIHYRGVSSENEAEVEKVLDSVHSHYKGQLRKAEGKKIFELQPDINWNKGKALHWLLKLFNLDNETVLPIYLGDDVTDEDAFFALLDHGLGVAVQDESKPTHAHFTLKNVDDVQKFLTLLIQS